MTTAPILLAYDGSPDAERALDWAADEARATGTTLVVTMVEDVEPAPVVAHVGHGATVLLPARAPNVLAHARMVLAEARVRSLTVEHRVGRVAGELLEAAEDASVVIVGASGHGAAGEIFLGSTSQHVARHAAGPVVVVRRPRSPGARRIVVGVDGSSGSRAALDYACARAERTGEDVVAVHGWRVRNPSTDAVSESSPALTDEEGRRVLLAESVAGVREDHPDVRLKLQAIAVEPSRCLVDASADASLVVVGARGHSLVGGPLLGSVSRKVLHYAQCPVAVVR